MTWFFVASYDSKFTFAANDRNHHHLFASQRTSFPSSLVGEMTIYLCPAGWPVHATPKNLNQIC